MFSKRLAAERRGMYTGYRVYSLPATLIASCCPRRVARLHVVEATVNTTFFCPRWLGDTRSSLCPPVGRGMIEAGRAKSRFVGAAGRRRRSCRRKTGGCGYVMTRRDDLRALDATGGADEAAMRAENTRNNTIISLGVVRHSLTKSSST